MALSGMGEAAAQRAGETLIRRCQPRILVSLGFAGALAPGLAAGDLVLGESFWHYNPDTRELKAGPHPAPPLPLPLLGRTLKQAGLNAISSSLITTTRIIHKGGPQGNPLIGLSQPVLDLETAALAALAAAHGLAFLSLRAITDAAEEELPEFLRNAGVQETQAGVRVALRWLAADCRRVKDLYSLWYRSRQAAQALARAWGVLWPLLLVAGDKLQGQPAQEGQIDEDPHPA